MAKFNNKTAVVGLGVLGVAGLAGAAFAASITVDDSNAGQGNGDVSGFEVSAIEYSTDVATQTVDDPTVDEVSFDIDRVDGPAVTAADAQVFVNLDGDAYVECDLDGNRATCDLTEGDNAVTYSEVADISVVAFDSTANT